jgi:hypothetical protein
MYMNSSPDILKFTLNMRAVFTLETLATLNTSLWFKDPSGESKSGVRELT